MSSQRLAAVPAKLVSCLTVADVQTPPVHGTDEIRRETHRVTMRDGVLLATDVYLPPTLPAPVVVRRTPYGRSTEAALKWILPFATRGFSVVTQDCRGTGESEPDVWDYYVYEAEDSLDCVEWIRQQPWADGFIGGCGASYAAQTQWCMARHSAMSAIAPEVSGLGLAANTASLHMFLNAYSRSVGNGAEAAAVSYEALEAQMLEETLSTGFFNEPLTPKFGAFLLARHPELASMGVDEAQHLLWSHYCSLSSKERAEWIRSVRDVDHVTIADIEYLPNILGRQIAHDAHTIPYVEKAELMASIRAPALMITGWYDWGLNDALATWKALQESAIGVVRADSRLVITPSAHKTPGYREGDTGHRELHHNHRVASHVDLLLEWNHAVRQARLNEWPNVVYYLMGANEWRCATAWPPEGVVEDIWYLSADGGLDRSRPSEPSQEVYAYDPLNPTPTIGGSIVSSVYRAGSVDVSDVQRRPDVLTFTSTAFDIDFDLVGPIKLVVFVSTSVQDTDFVGRLSDVFPDGRAIQLQNGLLRARYRSSAALSEPLVPGATYRLELDMWATANRFKAGHRMRLDISSADFPRFDRNTNLAGAPGEPLKAQQTIYFDRERSSHLVLFMLATT